MIETYAPFDDDEMQAHSDFHAGKGEGVSFTMSSRGDEQRMKCDYCDLGLIQTEERRKTRNTVQPAWAIEKFPPYRKKLLIIEWP